MTLTKLERAILTLAVTRPSEWHEFKHTAAMGRTMARLIALDVIEVDHKAGLFRLSSKRAQG